MSMVLPPLFSCTFGVRALLLLVLVLVLVLV
jgi:hypothetical protein